MDQNFPNLDDDRLQRRRRAYVVCFFMLSMLMVMNLIGAQISSQQKRAYVNGSIESKKYVDFIQMLQLEQGLFSNIVNNRNSTSTSGFTDNNPLPSLNKTVNNNENSSSSQNDNEDDGNILDLDSLDGEIDLNAIPNSDGEQIPFDMENLGNYFLMQHSKDMTNKTKLEYKENLTFIYGNKCRLADIVMYLYKKISLVEMNGLWNFQGESQKNLFQFENSSGYVQIQLIAYSKMSKEKRKLYFYIYDGSYVDQKRIQFYIEVDRKVRLEHVKGTSQVSMHGILGMDEWDKQNQMNKDKIRTLTKVTFDFKQPIEGQKVFEFSKDHPDMGIKIESENKERPFEINISIDHFGKRDFWVKALFYASLVTIIGVMHIFGTVKMLKNVFTHPQDCSKYSMGTLVCVYVWDGFFSGNSLIAALQDKAVFQYLLPPSIIYIILWMVFERTLILSVWKEQNRESFTSEAVFKNKQCHFFAKLYGAMFLLIIVTNYFLYTEMFMILINCYMVFQIASSAYRGQQTQIDPYYIWFLLVPRSIIPFYLRAIPGNVYYYHTSISTSLAILFILGLQIIIIYGQCYLGPRFFIPDKLQPNKFNYFMKIPDNLDLESGLNQEFTEDCSICVTPLHQQPGIDMNQNNSQDNPFFRRLRRKTNQIMRTPCNHKFHVQCLSNWMSIKMECPSCRQLLPPI